MISQDLTKLAVVMLFLGVVAAIAIFRLPIIASPADGTEDTTIDANVQTNPDQETKTTPSSQDLAEWQKELESLQTDLDERRTEQDRRQDELNEREAELSRQQADFEQRNAEQNQRQLGLDNREAKLNQYQKDLEARDAEQDKRELEFDRREAELNQRQAELDRRDAEQRQRQTALEAHESHLRAEEARLAEWEQALKNFRRWSLAMVGIGGMATVCSIVPFWARGRQNQQTASSGGQQAKTRQISKEEQTSDLSGFTSAILVPIQGGDGRIRESIGINCSGQ